MVIGGRAGDYTQIVKITCLSYIPMLGEKDMKMYSSLPLFMGNTFSEPLWMPETVDGTEPYMYCFFLYVHNYEQV